MESASAGKGEYGFNGAGSGCFDFLLSGDPFYVPVQSCLKTLRNVRK
jgi:uncharacterized protein (UPF0297 family)